jgi:hypothetical protein
MAKGGLNLRSIPGQGVLMLRVRGHKGKSLRNGSYRIQRVISALLCRVFTILESLRKQCYSPKSFKFPNFASLWNRFCLFAIILDLRSGKEVPMEPVTYLRRCDNPALSCKNCGNVDIKWLFEFVDIYLLEIQL